MFLTNTKKYIGIYICKTKSKRKTLYNGNENKIVIVVALCVIAATAAAVVHYLVANVIKTAAGL